MTRAPTGPAVSEEPVVNVAARREQSNEVHSSREQSGETVGVLVLVFDNGTQALADRLTDI